jgi:hypothetical protein
MLVENLSIQEKTKNNLREINNKFFRVKQGADLDSVISEVLADKDLFVYMATHSIPHSGVILGRMNYFDDINVEVPYGISYDFNNPSLNIFTFEFTPASVKDEIPAKTLQLGKMLSKRKGMGLGTYEIYNNYPSPEEFLKSLNNIFQKDIEKQKPFWVDFNKSFYR